jgi:hypothetical protein
MAEENVIAAENLQGRIPVLVVGGPRDGIYVLMDPLRIQQLELTPPNTFWRIEEHWYIYLGGKLFHTKEPGVK